MKVVLVVFSFLLFAIASSGQINNTGERVIFKLKSEPVSSGRSYDTRRFIGNNKVDHITKKFQIEEIAKHSLGRKSRQFVYTVKFPAGTNIQMAIDELYKTGEIEYAEPDVKGSSNGMQGIVPNDPFYNRQWSLKNNGKFSLLSSTAGSDLDMENAWSIETGDTNIIVGIIDSGCKLDHPEFSGRIWINRSEISNNGIDDDNNGFIDDVKGWNFCYANNDPTDDEGHGTNVTGIIGANGNNSIGYAGIDWKCKLMILKGIDSANFGYYSWWSDAIYYAVDNGAKVINMSLGGTKSSKTLQEAVTYAINNNVVVIASMGNTNSGIVEYPAGCSGVIAVGATDANDKRSDPFFWSEASGSNFGNHISVVAPGDCIYGLNSRSDTNYDLYWGGTSQAAPHVTGLASLLLAQNPDRSPLQIKSIIETTAEDRVGNSKEDVTGWDRYYGNGRINSYSALSMATDVNLFNAKNLSVYPNPSSGSIKISIPITLSVTCKIINELGQLVYRLETNSQQIEINEKFLPGVYLLVVSSGDKTLSKKIIVQ